MKIQNADDPTPTAIKPKSSDLSQAQNEREFKVASFYYSVKW